MQGNAWECNTGKFYGGETSLPSHTMQVTVKNITVE